MHCLFLECDREVALWDGASTMVSVEVTLGSEGALVGRETSTRGRCISWSLELESSNL